MKLGDKVRILLPNSLAKFHAKVFTHCWNIAKSNSAFTWLAVTERILLLAMLPAVSAAKDEVVSSRSPHIDSESFHLAHPPSTAPVVLPSRQGPNATADVPWPPPAPIITRTAATPMATPHGSPHGSSNDFAMSKNLRNTLTVDRVTVGSSSASSGTVRARVSKHLFSTH